MSVVTSRGSLQRSASMGPAGAQAPMGAQGRVPLEHQHQRSHQRGPPEGREPHHADVAHPPPCKECSDDISEMELHAEIEHLKRHLAERDAHIEAMESEFLKGNTRISELEDQIATWREKYDRLYDSHRRVQRVNQNLEEKLLQMADKCTEDKSQLTRDVETLSVRLAESNCTIGHLHKENERYKNDMNLAIQLLQCKPDNFVSQKFDSLPPETQARVSSYIMSKAKLNQDSSLQGAKSFISEKVNPDDFEFNISASLMSKILEESVQNTISSHCDTCTCLKKSINPFSFNKSQHSVSTQTVLRHEKLNALCFNCKSDITSLNSSLSGKCNSPISTKVFNEEKDLIQMSDTEKSSSVYSLNQISQNKVVANEQTPNSKVLKSPDENIKLVSMKHREIMTKIGDDIKQISAKDHRYTIPTLEPITGHHRLCDRTKNTGPECSNVKFDDSSNAASKNSCNNSSHSCNVSKPGLPINVQDITFGEIENSVLIPNTAEMKNEALPTKADLNSVSYKKVFHGSSISSNDAESKTSSNRSYQHGSNNKVHIGPGPRFCSLIMQAGSKNILLDNAQPNIAPVLYTRQSKHVESSTPLTSLYTSPMDVPMKHNTSFTTTSDHLSEFMVNEKKCNSSNVNCRLMDSVDTILDLPNDDIILKNPIDLIEKPESGYKSNESAEIIDKLLFNVENVLPVDPNKNVLQAEIPLENNPVANTLLEGVTVEKSLEKDKMVHDDVDTLFSEKKIPNDNLKMFNFDNYEKSLKHPASLNIQKDNVGVSVISDHEQNKISESHAFINESTELFNSNFDLKIASKNLSEINKKFQVLPENTLETQKAKEWKKETSTEKSSSSLSSDDSAAVLQKQQLIRVAEWVQKNLEMEQQIDFDNSDSCHQSAEEMHHVRNDFPRPAKVDHRIRKNNLKTSHKTSHHSSKHSFNIKANDNATSTMSQTCNTEELYKDNRLSYSQDYNMINFNVDCTEKEKNETDPSKLLIKQQSLNLDTKIPCTDVTTSNCTTKLYTKEELARMEYNVKQFLLNGTRWTKNPNEPFYSRARRTSSKTETDL